MNEETPRSDRRQQSAEDVIDKGLAEAFGGSTSEPSPSVLQRLQAQTGSELGLHLDSQGPDDAPVKVTEEAKQLRDPSGRYQVLGEIGRGGMGKVYKGRDQDLGRDVAMKVLRDEYADRPEVLARFVEEAQIGGQLQHPGIVPVYELGLQAGERPYFAMKLVKGETLAAQLARREDPAKHRRRFLGVFEQVCQTIAYAHARRVIHRDLKPANVMIGAFGEVQVVDWGFAKVLPKGGVADEEQSGQLASAHSVIETVRSTPGSGSHSVAGSMLGTPAFMPPEQALGDVERIDQHSDVFALGAILCEVLTGEPPYRKTDGDLARQAASAALNGAHERLRKCGADESLVTLCIECLSPARRARPGSAAEVAERVSGYLTSVEERARQAELNAARARYKHRTTLVSAAAALLILVLGAGAWSWNENQIRTRREETQQNIAAAMSAASGALGQAQAKAEGLDLTLWAAAQTSAANVQSLTRSADVEARVREQAEQLLTQVQWQHRNAQVKVARRDRDARMLTRLENLRIPIDDNARENGWQEKESRRLDEAYAEAFAEYLGGRSPLDQSIEESLTALSDGDIPVELAISLDHWSLVRDGLNEQADPPDPDGTAHIRELVARFDAEDPWRTQLRKLLSNARHEGERLRALAENADFDSLTATGCRVLSDALWSAGETGPSLSVLKRAQEVFPQDFDLCFRLAFQHELLDEPRWEEAIQIYRIAHALRPDHYEVRHRQGYSFDKSNRPAESERIFRDLYSRQPENSHWLRHIGLAVGAQDRLEEAIEIFYETVAINPHDAEAYRDLSKYLFKLDRREEAFKSTQEAIKILNSRAVSAAGPGPEDAHTWMTVAQRLVKLEKLDEAAECFLRTIDLDPLDPRSYIQLGAVLIKQQDREAATERFQEALEVAPDPMVPLVYFNLGTTLSGLGLWAEAGESYRRAIDLDPEFASAHYNLGVTLSRQGKWREAIECYREVIQLNPEDAEAHNNLGRVLVQDGQLEEAMRVLRQALELDPNFLLARQNLASVFLESEELVDAIDLYYQEFDVDPPSPSAVNILGLALIGLDRSEEAIDLFHRAIEIDPDFAPPYINLGDELRNRRDVEAARKAYQTAETLFASQSSAFARQWGSYARGEIRKLDRFSMLLEVLEGRRAAATPEDWAAAVEAGFDQQRLREVVALTEKTLAGARELIGDDSWGVYNSACAAALLAAVTNPDLTTAERARVRGLARAWLHREIEHWRAQLANNGANTTEPRQRLSHALQDPDFASVRGEALANLPKDERTSWEALWASIEAALKEDAP